MSYFPDYPQPPKDVFYIATLYNISLYWKYQSIGSGRFTGIQVDVRNRNESPVIISTTEKDNVTTLVFRNVEPLRDYILNLYVLTTVGKSKPSVIMASTNFKSKYFCITSMAEICLSL